MSQTHTKSAVTPRIPEHVLERLPATEEGRARWLAEDIAEGEKEDGQGVPHEQVVADFRAKSAAHRVR